jgi:[ribosomal protein S5]-alanine N-acetyltransferase
MIERLSESFATPRLDIRIVEARDLAGLLVVHADEEVTRFLPYDVWRSMDDARAWLARVAAFADDGKSRQFVMIERDGARPVGAIVLFNVDASNRRAELGYVLGRADWGRGLMREALDAFVAHAFDDLELRRIEAFADPRNVASHRLLLATGFAHEGLLRARGMQNGVVVDSNAYGLLREEFRPPAR